MKLKEIHDAYCEKQRIEQQEKIKAENDAKQKALEDKMRQENEIIAALKPMFVNEFKKEIEAIEEAGIKVSYVADIYESNTKLYIKLQKEDLTSFIVFDSKCSTKIEFYEYNRPIKSKEHLMSLVYQFFFCQ
jgi:acetate kinase